MISIQAFDPKLIINLSSEFLDVKTIHGTMPGVLYATRDFDLIKNGVGFKMKPNLDSVTCFTSCSNFDFICATLQLYIDKHF